MRKLFHTCVIVALAGCAFAQWPPRTIHRTVDVTRLEQRDAISWFRGEEVNYNLYLVDGAGSPWSLPTNGTARWRATDATLTNLVILTNSVIVNATNGHIRSSLSSAASAALAAETYFSAVHIFRPASGTNLDVGVVDRTDATVRWTP